MRRWCTTDMTRTSSVKSLRLEVSTAFQLVANPPYIYMQGRNTAISLGVTSLQYQVGEQQWFLDSSQPWSQLAFSSQTFPFVTVLRIVPVYLRVWLLQQHTVSAIAEVVRHYEVVSQQSVAKYFSVVVIVGSRSTSHFAYKKKVKKIYIIMKLM